jgi:hypothetical protein
MPTHKGSRRQHAESRAGRPRAGIEAQKKHEQASYILERYREGLSFRQIAQELSLHHSTVHDTFWREMRRLADERKHQASLAFEVIVQGEEETIRYARQMAYAPCVFCANDSQRRLVCGHCEGTGFQYSLRDRLRAKATEQRSTEALARLYDLTSQRVDVTINRDFLEEVEQLSDEQLLRELTVHLPEVIQVAASLPPPCE